MPAFIFNLLGYIIEVEVEVYEENMASYRFTVGKDNYFNNLFRRLWIFFDTAL